MMLSPRLQFHAAVAAALISILAAAAIGVATHAHYAIFALLSIAFTLGVLAIVALDRKRPARRPAPPENVTPFVPKRFSRGERATADK